MTQYDDRVEKQRIRNAAEQWAKIPCQIQSFNTLDTAVWYDTRRTDGRVTDTSYNDGTILREITETGETITMGEKLSLDKLVHKFLRHSTHEK